MSNCHLKRSLTAMAHVLGATAIVALLMFGLAGMFRAAHGHDRMHPELDQWFAKLHSGRGPCCDGSDALHLRDVDWQTQNKPDSHYRVKIPKDGTAFDAAAQGVEVDTEWVDVPDEAVIDEPNRDGATLVWPLYGYMSTSVRCFMPGSMT